MTRLGHLEDPDAWANSTLNLSLLYQSRDKSSLVAMGAIIIYIYLFLLSSSLRSCWPLLGVKAWSILGGRVKVDDGGILRIRLQQELPLTKVPFPPSGSVAAKSTLDSIEIRDTKTAKGFGAYCVRKLEENTFLGFYEGVIVPTRHGAEMMGPRSGYLMSMDGGATFVDGFERAQDRTRFSPVHLNHEDRGKPGCNCFRVLENGSVAFFTSRRVNVGEELCFDYDYWKGREKDKI